MIQCISYKNNNMEFFNSINIKNVKRKKDRKKNKVKIKVIKLKYLLKLIHFIILEAIHCCFMTSRKFLRSYKNELKQKYH